MTTVILIIYIIGLAVLSKLLSKQPESKKSAVIVAYNYIFTVPLYFFFQLPENATVPEALALIVRCAYQAPRALAFGADLTFFDEDPAIALLFYIVSMYTAKTVLFIFFRRAFISASTKLRILIGRDIFAVCGERGDAEAMIGEIRAEKPKSAVIFVPQNEEDAKALLPAMTETRGWEKIVRRKRDAVIILLPDKSGGNLQRLDELNALGAEKNCGKLHVTAFLDNDMIRFEDLSYPNLDAYLVSRESLLIREFLTKNLPLRTLSERGALYVKNGVKRAVRPFSVCILGFGALSREFLFSTWENASFESDAPDGRGFEALVIDSDIERRRAVAVLDAPEIKSAPFITWMSCAPDSEECFEKIKDSLGTLHQILIATDDTSVNLDIAMRLLRMFRRCGMEKDHPQIVIAVFEDADGSIKFISREPGSTFLQSNRSQFTYGELARRAADAKAEELHGQYIRNSMFPSDWNSIGTFLQNSNRAVVWDIPNKLLLAGDLSGKTDEEKDRIYWELARYEHRRWNTFQYTHGWTLLPLSEMTEEEKEKCVTKRKSEKRHACLVPWDELDALPQSRPGIIKYYDYENVLHLFEPERDATLK